MPERMRGVADDLRLDLGESAGDPAGDRCGELVLRLLRAGADAAHVGRAREHLRPPSPGRSSGSSADAVFAGARDTTFCFSATSQPRTSTSDTCSALVTVACRYSVLRAVLDHDGVVARAVAEPDAAVAAFVGGPNSSLLVDDGEHAARVIRESLEEDPVAHVVLRRCAP